MPGNDERRIKNMKGLLKFCVGATQMEDASSSSTLEAMSEERRRWLEEALTSMSTDPVKAMKECLKRIDDAEVDTEEGTEQQLKALEEIGDWVEDLDLAVDFVKINGLRIIPKLLQSEVSELRWRCLEVLANLCQNNPQVQKTVLDLQLLPVVLAMVQTDPNPTVRIKAMYALSCLTRSNALAQDQLVAHENGLSTLVSALEGSEEKLKTKAIFLISAMCQFNPALKDSFLDKGVVQQMLAVLKGDHCDSHEHLMSALLSLVSTHVASKQFCLQESINMKTFLVKRINFLDGKEEFQEERSYAEQLLAELNKISPEAPLTSSASNALMPA